MMERLRRIMDLSKKTGDTVIVHDVSATEDFVVVPFGRYEELILAPGHDHFDEYLLEEMSERELIDKINRDIAIWRSYQELNIRDRHAALLEDQLADEPLPDPFEEDFTHQTDWHRVSDLIGDRRGKQSAHEIALETEEDDTSEPIHTYVPVHEQMPVSSDTFAPLSSSSKEDKPLFEEESLLEGDDDDMVFFEEPAS